MNQEKEQKKWQRVRGDGGDTEYTQSGNSRLLAYIPMMEKWCTPTPPFTYQLNIKCKITVYLLLFHLYPYVLCVEEKGRRGLPL